jgi:hypothetical protein
VLSPLRVDVALIDMLPAIQLNDELPRAADKVDNERTDWILARKSQIAELAIPQMSPQPQLSIRARASKVTSERHIDSLH